MKNIEKRYKILMTLNIVLIVLVVALGVYTFAIKDSLGIGDNIGLSPGSSIKVLATGTQDAAVSGQIINTESKVDSRSQLCLISGSGATSSTSCIAKRSAKGSVPGTTYNYGPSLLFWNDAKGGDFIFGFPDRRNTTVVRMPLLIQRGGGDLDMVYITNASLSVSSLSTRVYTDGNRLILTNLRSSKEIEFSSDLIKADYLSQTFFSAQNSSAQNISAYVCVDVDGALFRKNTACN